MLNLVSAIEAAAALEASAKQIRFAVLVPAELYVFADPHLIASAIGNLVQNAVKFTVRGSAVSIKARCVGDRVLIDVEDQCGGLPTADIERLFQPFSQAAPNRTGVGLGLTICRKAVELNDGSVSARDVPGHGCVFTIDLPSAA